MKILVLTILLIGCEDGTQGPRGVQGKQGMQGAQGTPGANGLSCSVIQLKKGVTITCPDGSMAVIDLDKFNREDE